MFQFKFNINELDRFIEILEEVKQNYFFDAMKAKADRSYCLTQEEAYKYAQKEIDFTNDVKIIDKFIEFFDFIKMEE